MRVNVFRGAFLGASFLCACHAPPIDPRSRSEVAAELSHDDRLIVIDLCRINDDAIDVRAAENHVGVSTDSGRKIRPQHCPTGSAVCGFQHAF